MVPFLPFSVLQNTCNLFYFVNIILRKGRGEKKPNNNKKKLYIWSQPYDYAIFFPLITGLKHRRVYEAQCWHHAAC